MVYALLMMSLIDVVRSAGKLDSSSVSFSAMATTSHHHCLTGLGWNCHVLWRGEGRVFLLKHTLTLLQYMPGPPASLYMGFQEREREKRI